MDEAERKAISKANQFLNKWMGGQVSRRDFLYFEAPDQRRFCYTPWKNKNGDYFTWVLKPYGKGAHSGKATHWKRVGKVVTSRKRKTACARARKRYEDWLDYKFGGG